MPYEATAYLPSCGTLCAMLPDEGLCFSPVGRACLLHTIGMAYQTLPVRVVVVGAAQGRFGDARVCVRVGGGRPWFVEQCLT